jgi:nucleotide-binding universal stress UspA family protein
MDARRFRIVIALDGSEFSEIVLEHAFDQAARHDEVDLHLVTIADDADDIDLRKRWLARIALEGLDSFAAHKGQWRTRLHVRVGKTDEEVGDLAAEVDADMLVIGNYGIHKRKPIAERIIERVSCPTLIVGLSGQTVEAEPQCPDCVAIRESSDGEAWFCAKHRGHEDLRLSTLVGPGGPSLHGGTLW